MESQQSKVCNIFSKPKNDNFKFQLLPAILVQFMAFEQKHTSPYKGELDYLKKQFFGWQSTIPSDPQPCTLPGGGSSHFGISA